MKNKKLIIALASVAMIAVVAIGGTLAYFTDSDSVEDNVELGRVQVSITEKTNDDTAVLTKNEDGTVSGIEYSDIMPGDVISKEPVIIVGENSSSAYIRAKIEIKGVDGAYSQEDGLEDHLKDVTFNTSECDWILGEDGYYYYQKPVQALDEISVFTETYIPTSWGAEIKNKSFEISIYGEAIQEAYMELVKDGDSIVGWNQ